MKLLKLGLFGVVALAIGMMAAVPTFAGDNCIKKMTITAQLDKAPLPTAISPADDTMALTVARITKKDGPLFGETTANHVYIVLTPVDETNKVPADIGDTSGHEAMLAILYVPTAVTSEPDGDGISAGGNPMVTAATEVDNGATSLASGKPGHILIGDDLGHMRM